MAYQNRGRRSSSQGGGSSHSRRSSGGRRTFGGNRGGGRQGGRRGPRKENIHPSKFIKAARPAEEKVYTAKNQFADFDVAPLLHDNIAKKGFKTPSPIQDQAIPFGLDGRDVVGIADTGTGKTVAFAVPVLDKLMKNSHSSVIIMAPTRELAHQILEEFESLSRGSDLRTVLLIGGTPMHRQLQKLKRNPRIIIGTPGRIKDHLKRKSLRLERCDTVVLDEVDRMLDMGFVGDMREILEHLAGKRQSLFFSATMDGKVKTLIEEFSLNAETISLKTGDTSDNVEQGIVQYASREDKIEKLHGELIKNKEGKFLIFDETKRGVDKLSKELNTRGFRSDAIHGNKSQGQRQRALTQFKANRTRILVATDVAARGIDVPDITHVINYATPQSYSDYVHRVGRAGRAGRMGQALTFIEGKDGSPSASFANKSSRSKQSVPRRNSHEPSHRPKKPYNTARVAGRGHSRQRG